jgi:hypothetical protein
VSADLAVVSVLAYRAVAIWLPAAAGLLALGSLRRTLDRWAREDERPPAPVAVPRFRRPAAPLPAYDRAAA